MSREQEADLTVQKTSTTDQKRNVLEQEISLKDQKAASNNQTLENQKNDSADEEVEIVNVMKVCEIPIPEADIVISDDDVSPFKYC